MAALKRRMLSSQGIVDFSWNLLVINILRLRPRGQLVNTICFPSRRIPTRRLHPSRSVVQAKCYQKGSNRVSFKFLVIIFFVIVYNHGTAIA